MLGIRLLAILVILASGCSIRTYDIAHQNLSDKIIFVKKGIWATEIRGGGFISGYSPSALFPSRKIISGITGEIPENIGVVWVNSEEKTIEEHIPLNKKKLPILNSGDSYKFVITLNQEYIYQFEVVVIPEGAPRRKKEKRCCIVSMGRATVNTSRLLQQIPTLIQKSLPSLKKKI